MTKAEYDDDDYEHQLEASLTTAEFRLSLEGKKSCRSSRRTFELKRHRDLESITATPSDTKAGACFILFKSPIIYGSAVTRCAHQTSRAKTRYPISYMCVSMARFSVSISLLFIRRNGVWRSYDTQLVGLGVWGRCANKVRIICMQKLNIICTLNTCVSHALQSPFMRINSM